MDDSFEGPCGPVRHKVAMNRKNGDFCCSVLSAALSKFLLHSASAALSNYTTNELKHQPSSGENLDLNDDNPQFPGMFPLQIGDYVLSLDPSFYCLDPRFTGLISSHIAFIAFVEYIRAKNVHQSVNVGKYSVMKPDFHTMPNLPFAHRH